MHKHKLKNGKAIEYHEEYCSIGVIIYVKTQMTKEETEEFRRYLESERDLVRLHTNCKCQAYCS